MILNIRWITVVLLALTFVPIDLDALLPEEMTEEERKMLNSYHKKVYETVSPHLNEEEKQWLREYTRPI